MAAHVAVGRRLAPFVAAALVALAFAARADAAIVTQPISFTADDGVVLHATVGGDGSLARRPLIVEDSPYAPGSTRSPGRPTTTSSSSGVARASAAASLRSTGLARPARPRGVPRLGLRSAMERRPVPASTASRRARSSPTTRCTSGLPCVKGGRAHVGDRRPVPRPARHRRHRQHGAGHATSRGRSPRPGSQNLPGRLQQQPASAPASRSDSPPLRSTWPATRPRTPTGSTAP